MPLEGVATVTFHIGTQELTVFAVPKLYTS